MRHSLLASDTKSTITQLTRVTTNREVRMLQQFRIQQILGQHEVQPLNRI